MESLKTTAQLKMLGGTLFERSMVMNLHVNYTKKQLVSQC